MIRRPPRSTLSSSSAASDVYKRQLWAENPAPEPSPAPAAEPPESAAEPAAEEPAQEDEEPSATEAEDAAAPEANPTPAECSATAAPSALTEAEAEEMFKLYNSDGDDLLSTAELLHMIKVMKGKDEVKLSEVMKVWDKDKDGKVTKAEFVARVLQICENKPAWIPRIRQMNARSRTEKEEEDTELGRAARMLFDAFDTDESGSLQADEVEVLLSMCKALLKEKAREQEKEFSLLSPKSQDAEKHRRQEALLKVFKEMDDDDSGYVEAAELLLLGQARRKLGHKQGEWTVEKNDKMVAKMDKNGDGHISAEEFAAHFETILPRGTKEFDWVIQQFMQVAGHCSSKTVAAAAASGEGDAAPAEAEHVDPMDAAFEKALANRTPEQILTDSLHGITAEFEDGQDHNVSRADFVSVLKEAEEAHKDEVAKKEWTDAIVAAAQNFAAKAPPKTKLNPTGNDRGCVCVVM
eukprot:TRINITY_DN7287_c0_g1_i6.p1 TRINITY_DN7287_c0_g1~~TRINITY_DN7287_c0_g1_i6.p1  ORF type:complete len:465 (-),score=192.02 TRINITY_DN7287_c0_g1_i6:334-1728(-)